MVARRIRRCAPGGRRAKLGPRIGPRGAVKPIGIADAPIGTFRSERHKCPTDSRNHFHCTEVHAGRRHSASGGNAESKRQKPARSGPAPGLEDCNASRERRYVARRKSP
jgi:hypothetical protein